MVPLPVKGHFDLQSEEPKVEEIAMQRLSLKIRNHIAKMQKNVRNTRCLDGLKKAARISKSFESRPFPEVKRHCLVLGAMATDSEVSSRSLSGLAEQLR